MGDSQPHQTTKTVETSIGPVTVHKLVLFDFAKIFGCTKNVKSAVIAFWKKNAEVSKSSQDNDAKMKLEVQDIFDLVYEYGEVAVYELAEAISHATDKTKDDIGKLDPVDLVQLVNALLEVNNIGEIINQVKKAWAPSTASGVSKK